MHSPCPRPTVLVTRPPAEAAETAARLRALGFTPLLAPVLRVTTRPLRLAPELRPQAVLLTSGNALPALPATLHATPLLAVGDATAARAQAAGFATVHSAGRDALALAALASARCDPTAGPLLLACGSLQGDALVGALRKAGFAVLRRVAYAARPVPRLPAVARAALMAGEVQAALFFSPASARAFAAALSHRLDSTRRLDGACLGAVRAVAISAATADALHPLPWRDIRVASRPNQDELLACLR